jgi:hypothetical protein
MERARVPSVSGIPSHIIDPTEYRILPDTWVGQLVFIGNDPHSNKIYWRLAVNIELGLSVQEAQRLAQNAAKDVYNAYGLEDLQSVSLRVVAILERGFEALASGEAAAENS